MLYSTPDARTSQCCLKMPVHCNDTGLLSGIHLSTNLLPAPLDSGVRFLRTDVDPEHALIPASWRNIVNAPLFTTLGNEYGVTVSAVEYLLATLRIFGIDNALIEISGEEVPAIYLSGISLDSMINKAGVVNQQVPRFGIWIERSIEITQSGQTALSNPSTRPTITAEIVSTNNNAYDWRFLSVPLLDQVFTQQILPAQAYGLDDQVYRLLEKNESLYGAFALEDFQQNMKSHPDFIADLPASMILQSLGDFVLAEAPIFGHLFICNPVHRLSHAMMREIFARPDAWSGRSYAKICQLCTYEQDWSNSNLNWPVAILDCYDRQGRIV